MKLRSLAIVIASLASLFACEKTSDVPAMQDEANGIVSMYKPRFDELSKRVIALEQRGRMLPPDPPGVGEARTLFVDTNKKLGELRGLIEQAPNAISTATKADNPRGELVKLMGEISGRLDEGQTEVNTNLDAVESWLTQTEWRPRGATPPPPVTPPPPTPEPQPQPQPESNPGPH